MQCVVYLTQRDSPQNNPQLKFCNTKLTKVHNSQETSFIGAWTLLDLVPKINKGRGSLQSHTEKVQISHDQNISFIDHTLHPGTKRSPAYSSPEPMARYIIWSRFFLASTQNFFPSLIRLTSFLVRLSSTACSGDNFLWREVEEARVHGARVSSSPSSPEHPEGTWKSLSKSKLSSAKKQALYQLCCGS